MFKEIYYTAEVNNDNLISAYASRLPSHLDIWLSRRGEHSEVLTCSSQHCGGTGGFKHLESSLFENNSMQYRPPGEPSAVPFVRSRPRYRQLQPLLLPFELIELSGNSEVGSLCVGFWESIWSCFGGVLKVLRFKNKPAVCT